MLVYSWILMKDDRRVSTSRTSIHTAWESWPATSKRSACETPFSFHATPLCLSRRNASSKLRSRRKNPSWFKSSKERVLLPRIVLRSENAAYESAHRPSSSDTGGSAFSISGKRTADRNGQYCGQTASPPVTSREQPHPGAIRALAEAHFGAAAVESAERVSGRPTELRCRNYHNDSRSPHLNPLSSFNGRQDGEIDA